MSPHTARAQMLMRQRRFAMAQEELGRALAADPDDGVAHAWLGVCLMEQDKAAEARAALGQAVRLMPESGMPHYFLGHLALREHRHDAARKAADEAVRLDPEDAEFCALRAQIEASAQRWRDALTWANRGLALDGEHGKCLNLRGLAQTHLGQKGDAAATLDGALKNAPDDPMAHTARGFQLLHANRPKEALDHFREALRLEPGFEPAKVGLIEALKARNPVYRVLLAFFLWMSRLSPGVQVGVLIGGYVLFRIALSLREAQPGLGLVLTPLIVGYLVFAVLTWIAVPLTDLLLRVSRYGRHALPERRRKASTVFGLLVLLPVVVLVGGVAVLTAVGVEAGTERGDALLGTVALYAAFSAFLLLPAAGVLTRVDHFRFVLYMKVLGALYGLWATAFVLELAGVEGGASLFGVFQLGLIASIWFLALSGTQPQSR